MIALVDADLICYAIGFSTETEEDISKVKYQVDDYIYRRLQALETKDCRLYLTDSKNNFRLALFPEYKRNRKDFVKPKWYSEIKQHLIDGWSAEIIERLEADDCIGIDSTQTPNCIIVSNDKDLDQLPGLHMNMSTFAQYEVTPEQGIKNLYMQWLIGDRIDNVPGIPFVGKIKAERLVAPCKTEDEIRTVCLNSLETAVRTQKNVGPSLWMNRWKHLMCLHLLRTPEQYEMVMNNEDLEEWVKSNKFLQK
jgi:DNA polymerase-1